MQCSLLVGHECAKLPLLIPLADDRKRDASPLTISQSPGLKWDASVDGNPIDTDLDAVFRRKDVGKNRSYSMVNLGSSESNAPLTRGSDASKMLVSNLSASAEAFGENGNRRELSGRSEISEWLEVVISKSSAGLEWGHCSAVMGMPTFETDPVILARRQKQIAYGKNTIGYNNYLRMTSKDQRNIFQPGTPDRYKKASRRSWDGEIKAWRVRLHAYDHYHLLEQTTDKNNNKREEL